MTIASILREYLDSPEPTQATTPIEQLELQPPGLCVIASPFALLRRRLMVATVLKSLLNQVDNNQEQAGLHLFSVDGAHLMLSELLLIEQGIDLSNLRLRGQQWEARKPSSANDLPLLSAVANVTGAGQDTTQEALSLTADSLTLHQLTSRISAGKIGSQFFVENIHHCTLKAGQDLQAELTEVRKIALARKAKVYVGVGAMPEAGLFSHAGKEGERARVNPATALPAALTGIEHVVDKLVYLEPGEGSTVHVAASCARDFYLHTTL